MRKLIQRLKKVAPILVLLSLLPVTSICQTINEQDVDKILNRYRFIKGGELMAVYQIHFNEGKYIQQVVGLDGTEAVRVNGTYSININGSPIVILHPDRILKSQEYNIFEGIDVNKFIYDYTKYKFVKASDEHNEEFINADLITNFDKPLYFLEDLSYGNEFYYFSKKIPNKREQDSINSINERTKNFAQDLERKLKFDKVNVKIVEQSEKFSTVEGVIKLETYEGFEEKRSKPINGVSYLPIYKWLSDKGDIENFGLKNMLSYSFELEGKIFYFLELVLSEYNPPKYREPETKYYYYFFKQSALNKLKNIINTADGKIYRTLDYEYVIDCYRRFCSDYGDVSNIINNKEMIRKLLTGKVKDYYTNLKDYDPLFYIKSEMVDGENIIKFNYLKGLLSDRQRRQYRYSKDPLEVDYFITSREHFEELFRFEPYIDPDQHFKNGIEEFKSNNYQVAIKEFTKAINSNVSKIYNAYLYRGVSYYYLNDFNAANSDYTKAIELIDICCYSAEESTYFLLFALRANAKYNIGDYKGALDDTKQNLEPDLFALETKGLILMELKKYREAIITFSNAIAKERKPILFKLRGDAHYHYVKNEKAFEDYNSAINLKPDFVAAFLGRARVYFAMQNYQASLEDCNKALEIDTEFYDGYYQRSIAYYELKDYNNSLADINKYIDKNSENLEAYLLRAKIYFMLNDYNNANKDFTIIYNSDQFQSFSNEKLIRYIADTKFYIGEYNNALELYSKILETKPNDTKTLISRAYCFIKLGLFNNAIVDYNAMINIDPKDQTAFLQRAITKNYIEDFDGAYDDAKFILKIESTDDKTISEAYIQIGISLLGKGKDKKACKNFHSALELGSDEADKYLSKYCN